MWLSSMCHGDVGLGEINNAKINYIILVLTHIPITGIVNWAMIQIGSQHMEWIVCPVGETGSSGSTQCVAGDFSPSLPFPVLVHLLLIPALLTAVLMVRGTCLGRICSLWFDRQRFWLMVSDCFFWNTVYNVSLGLFSQILKMWLCISEV
jgi:hypothetical protein